MKFCPNCDKYKTEDNFYKDRSKKDGLKIYCKECRRLQSKEEYIKYKQRILNQQKDKYKKYPWKRTLKGIKDRCNNSNNKDYNNYGGRGIECRITEEELKELWFRDKAYEMKWPSIDREDNDGHYEFENCRYLEFGDNSGKDKTTPILQYDLDGNFIREWESLTEASKCLNIFKTNISSNIRGKTKQSCGFVWKYKNE